MIVRGKILLFGEYFVLNDAQGLALPLVDSEMRFEYDAEDDLSLESHATLKAYFDYIKRPEFEGFFDNTLYANDLTKGVYLASNIPKGYGAGSSGAFCASILKRYGHPLKDNSALALKTLLIKMEGYFHGESSGIDPLVSYLNSALLIDGPQIDIVDLARLDAFKFELIDTGIARKTTSFVGLFREKMADKGFAMAFEAHCMINNQCIDALLNNDAHFYVLLKQISQFQYTYFSEMIPAAYRAAWAQGLADDTGYYKLCGAGGGGYLIRFTDSQVRPRCKV